MPDNDLYKKIGMLEEKLTARAEKIHEQEVRIADLENSLWRIANPLLAMQRDAAKDGLMLYAGAAVEIANDANTLKNWAELALQK